MNIAVAAAVAVSFFRSRGKPNAKAPFNALVDLAKTILVDGGFDSIEADRKIRRRLQCREDLETAIAAIHAEEDAEAPPGKRSSKPRAANRGSLPNHLPRIEEVVEMPKKGRPSRGRRKEQGLASRDGLDLE